MYQVILQKYGQPSPEGVTYRTTEALEDFIHDLDFTSLVYVEVRYVRSIKGVRRSKDNPPDTGSIPQQRKA